MADNKPGKIMSSRLMTMKFMQRAAAASPQTTPTKADGSQPPTKRRRISDDGRPSPQTDETRAIAEALAAEEQKRQIAVDRQAAAAGETKWVFSYLDQGSATRQTPIKITTVGYSTIDGGTPTLRHDESHGQANPGRRNFGQFGKAVEEPAKVDLDDQDDDDTDSDSDDEDDDGDNAEDTTAARRDPRGDHIREKRKAKRKSDQAESLRMAAQRRTKTVNINSSGRSSLGGSPLTQMSNQTCHGCGTAGHLRRDCPGGAQRQGKKRRSMA